MMNKLDNKQDIFLKVEDLKVWFPIKTGIFSRTIGFVRAVDGVSLSINAGETLGLVGESGCGKTTLGRTLMGLEKASGGRVIFENNEILNITSSEARILKRKMQIIFQDPLSALNPRMNILDIVTEGLSEFNMIQGSKEAHAIQLLKEVGLDEGAIYRFPHEFSGGQRQRICVARAISLRPSFIVCDEPVSALDVSVQAQVVNLLLDLSFKYKLSYLFISHDLSIVSYIADKLAVMYLGKIVEYGLAADIIKHPMHPYTQALFAAVPIPGVIQTNRTPLPGETPSPSSPPQGCRFHPRCPRVMDVCRHMEPMPLIREARQVCCHLYD